MASYAFMNELLDASESTFERCKKEAEEAEFLAELKVEEELEVDDSGQPINDTMYTIRADPDDHTGSYSGKGHTTSAYTPCDWCQYPRGVGCGAYKLVSSEGITIRVCCLSCWSYYRKHKRERPSDLFGKNPEAKELAAVLEAARAKKRGVEEKDGEGEVVENEDERPKSKKRKKKE